MRRRQGLSQGIRRARGWRSRPAAAEAAPAAPSTPPAVSLNGKKGPSRLVVLRAVLPVGYSYPPGEACVVAITRLHRQTTEPLTQADYVRAQADAEFEAQKWLQQQVAEKSRTGTEAPKLRVKRIRYGAPGALIPGDPVAGFGRYSPKASPIRLHCRPIMLANGPTAAIMARQ